MRPSLVESFAIVTVMSIKLSIMQLARSSWAGLLGPSAGPQYGITGGSGSAAAVRTEERDNWDANAANQSPHSPSRPIGSASTVQCIRRVVHTETLPSHSPVALNSALDFFIVTDLLVTDGIMALHFFHRTANDQSTWLDI